MGLTKEIINKTTETQVRVSLKRDCVEISFDGSRQVRDWLTNLDTRMLQPFKTDLTEKEKISGLYSYTTDSELQKVKVHRGIIVSLNSVYVEIIVNTLNFLIMNPHITKIKVIGYSLGGALAQYLAMRLYNEIYVLKSFPSTTTLDILDTKGAYKCFNSIGAKWFLDKIKHNRYVYGNDSVPLFPMLPWYKHTATRIDYKGVKRKFPWIELFPIMSKHHTSY